MSKWEWKRSNGEIYWQFITEVLREKPFLAPLCSPQIPHGYTWDRTKTCMVRGQWLMTEPLHGSNQCLGNISRNTFSERNSHRWTMLQCKYSEPWLFFMVAVLELILTTVHTTTPAHYAVAHRAVVHRCVWVSFYSGFYVLLTVGAPKLKRCL
jgi:hypothetical protein